MIFSDTHGRIDGLETVIRRHNPDTLFHLGDCVRDAEGLRRLFPEMTVYAVSGNCDFGGCAPAVRVVAWHGLLLYQTHGHRHGVKRSLYGLAEAAAAARASVALFGHTHSAADVTINGVRLCNPGSVSYPRGGPASYGVLTSDGVYELFERRSI